MVKMVAAIQSKSVHWLYVESIPADPSKIDNLHAVGNIPIAITTHVFEDAI
jgi:hypothetical protein